MLSFKGGVSGRPASQYYCISINRSSLVHASSVRVVRGSCEPGFEVRPRLGALGLAGDLADGASAILADENRRVQRLVAIDLPQLASGDLARCERLRALALRGAEDLRGAVRVDDLHIASPRE